MVREGLGSVFLLEDGHDALEFKKASFETKYVSQRSTRVLNPKLVPTWPSVQTHDRNCILSLREQRRKVNLIRRAIIIQNLCGEIGKAVDLRFDRSPRWIAMSFRDQVTDPTQKRTSRIDSPTDLWLPTSMHKSLHTFRLHDGSRRSLVQAPSSLTRS